MGRRQPAASASHSSSVGDAPDSSSWQDLRDRYLEALSRPSADRPGRWLEIWRLFIEHPWYQQELQSCARAVLRSGGAPSEWQKDVEHDAMLLLVRKLRKRPDLGIDPVRAQKHFRGWMGTIITRDCRDALRRLRRLYSPSADVPKQQPAADRGPQCEARVELSLAVEQLDDPERAVLLLYANGLTIRRIAAELDLGYWRTYRAFRTGLEQLRRLLAEPDLDSSDSGANSARGDA